MRASETIERYPAYYTLFSVRRSGRIETAYKREGRLQRSTVYPSWTELLQRRKPFTQDGPIVIVAAGY